MGWIDFIGDGISPNWNDLNDTEHSYYLNMSRNASQNR